MISAFIAAIGNAFEVVESKNVLNQHKMSSRTFLSVGSILIFLCMIPFFVLGGSINFESVQASHVFAFLGIIAVAYVYNYLFYASLKSGKLCDMEALVMFLPLVTMILAILIYPDERNYSLLAPALIASLALVFSRVEKHHLKLDKASLMMVGFVFLMAIESNLAKYALEIFNPIALYAIRIGILSVLFFLAVRPNFHSVGKAQFLRILIIAFVVAIEYIAFYMAIERLGIVATSLVMLLAPVLILLSSKFLLGEKSFTAKKALSDVVILICIAVGIIIK